MLHLCIRCGRHRFLWQFNLNKKGFLGLQTYCRECQKLHNSAYRRDNVLRRAVYRKSYNKSRRKETAEYNSCYHFNNRNKIIDRQRLYRKENLDKDAERSARRRAIKKEQSPPLNDEEKYRVALLYKWSNLLGKDFQVDHIEPLSNGGLHHPDNMHIIHRQQNLRKKNRDPKEFYGRHYSFIVDGISP